MKKTLLVPGQLSLLGGPPVPAPAPATRRTAPAAPLAWTVGVLATDQWGQRGRLTVEVSRAGAHHHARRDALAALAHGHGLDARRTQHTPWINGKNMCGDGPTQTHPAQLEIAGGATELAAFAAAVPQLLAAIEHAADQAGRQFGRWLRDSVTGQAAADGASSRSLQRDWRRRFITAAAEHLGPHATRVSDTTTPDWRERWDTMPYRFAAPAARRLDTAACADPLAAAMLLARAQADAPYTYEQALEIARASRRPRSILDFPEYQVCPDRGNVVTHTGPAPDRPEALPLPARRTRLRAGGVRLAA